MPATIKSIYRYPVKGFSPDPLGSVQLAPGATLPFDRAYAIENGPIGFDPALPGYFPKIRFVMLMRNERIARLKTRFDAATSLWTIEENGALAIAGRLNEAAERAALEAWIARYFAADLRGYPTILQAAGHSFSDVAKKVLHVVNLASVRELARHIGRPVDPLRFRANLYVDGIPAWSEFDWLGQTLAADTIALKGVKRTERCAATNVDPVSAERDMTLPLDLMRLYGHTDCGIYMEVVTGGRLTIGETLRVTQLALDFG